MAKDSCGLNFAFLATTTSMTAKQTKASRELQVFCEFIQKSGLPIDHASIESRKPPEPDILCRDREEGFVAFELTELCDHEIAKTIADNVRSSNAKPGFMWNTDPCHQILENKLAKNYQTDHPIQLLCYTAARVVTPDDVIIATIRDILATRGLGTFRRVWFLGEYTCQIIMSSV